MRSLKHFIAFFSVIAFGASFATTEVHSAVICDASSQAQLQEKVAQTPAFATKNAPSHEDGTDAADACHCPNAANCSFIFSSNSESDPFTPSRASFTFGSDEIFQIVLAGPIKPPCALSSSS